MQGLHCSIDDNLEMAITVNVFVIAEKISSIEIRFFLSSPPSDLNFSCIIFKSIFQFSCTFHSPDTCNGVITPRVIEPSLADVERRYKVKCTVLLKILIQYF